VATPASVFLSTWRDYGVLLYEIHPRYHTRSAPIILGYTHGVSRYYHLPDDLERLREAMHLPGPNQSFEAWLNQLGVPDRAPCPPPEPAPAAPHDSWDPQAHPPIL
jgi:hypothetical protein